MKKLDKKFLYNAAFFVGLLVFTVIALNLPVGWFTIVMPIFAGAILCSIFFLKEDK